MTSMSFERRKRNWWPDLPCRMRTPSLRSSSMPPAISIPLPEAPSSSGKWCDREWTVVPLMTNSWSHSATPGGPSDSFHPPCMAATECILGRRLLSGTPGGFGCPEGAPSGFGGLEQARQCHPSFVYTMSVWQLASSVRLAFEALDQVWEQEAWETETERLSVALRCVSDSITRGELTLARLPRFRGAGKLVERVGSINREFSARAKLEAAGAQISRSCSEEICWFQLRKPRDPVKEAWSLNESPTFSPAEFLDIPRDKARPVPRWASRS
mmetsp:Transcript_9487/g.22840  ORF Transcript_9487/g.22840 Transcript_9487/m.22840 type:complete len:270 (+) Transcript_9487:165-974(+)